VAGGETGARARTEALRAALTLSLTAATHSTASGGFTPLDLPAALVAVVV
jgi:hypothetical protein